ncbi:uncharacterized protein LOC143152311 [Ptiloglossa arizonensis]|uniref:uncharacterized protein LOC143152311 n=1 Tax=Ptiloglossa arizonensis TaxID=3350558 RepID=UPI003F9F1E50
MKLLVDTGADVCVFPRSRVKGRPSKGEFELYATNGTHIATYGTTVVSLNLSLRREFTWRFIVADVDAPIIGMDFLVHYNLLVDPRNKRLLDATTKLFVVGRRVTDKVASVKTINDSVYHRLLAEYPDLIKPPVFRMKTVKHDVVHHILTTPEPPVHHKPKRLAPDRYQAAKAEFELMLVSII